MNTESGTPAHNNAYDVKIIETYHGDKISAHLFESVAREDLTDLGIHPMKPELPFGVCVYFADTVTPVPGGFHRFPTLDSARAYLETIE